jgi:large subunit ribosomal protein L19
MQSLVNKIEDKYKKGQVVDVKTGDTVRVHQKIKEGNKERVQIFEGMVIRTSRNNSLTSSITVRRIASGVGVEKSFIVHGPNVLKIEVTKRSKVRRNYLTYIRTRTGKATRLTGVDFDKHAVNEIRDLEVDNSKKISLGARRKKTTKEKAKSAKKAPRQKKADQKKIAKNSKGKKK